MSKDDLKNLAAKFKITVPSQIDQSQSVLLMDDQQDQRLIISHHLGKMGYKNIKQCANGLDAFEILKAHGDTFSVVLASMESKVLGGIELLQEIQDSADVKRPPFLISMHSPSREKIMLATESGVDEIVVKPYTLKDIVPKMQRAFKVFHNPLNPEKVYELAKQMLRDKNLDTAKAIYTEIANVTTSAARPWVGLARIAVMEDQLEEALSHLEKAEKCNPHYVQIFTTRGRILVKKGKHEEAIKMFAKAIEISPLNPMRYEDAATSLFELKQYKEAINLLGVAVKNELSFPKLHHFLSQAYYAEKDYKMAIRHIRSALNAEPDNIIYLNQLGISYKESNQFDEASKIYNSIIKLDPENKAALYNKAILLNSMKKTAEAVKILERILKKDPSFGPAQTKKREYEAALEKGEDKAS